MLECGVDMVVCNVCIGVMFFVDYDMLFKLICVNVGIILLCESEVKIEMCCVDLINWVGFLNIVDCIDCDDCVLLFEEFQVGGVNELMVICVCVLFDLVFLMLGLGKQLFCES